MLIPVIAIVFILLILLFVVAARRKKEAQKDIFYNRLVDRYKGSVLKDKTSILSGRTYHMSGSYEGNQFEIFEELRNAGKSKVYFTSIRFQSVSNFEFRIAKENFFSRMGKLIGFNDIEFNDYEIDRVFLFKSKNEEAFRALMGSSLIYELDRNKSSFDGSLAGGPESFIYSIKGEIVKEETCDKIESMIELMSKFLKA